MPHEGDYKQGGPGEVALGEDEAESGRTPAQDIEPFTFSLDYSDFPKLEKEQEGDRVMLLVMGEIVSKDKKQTTVEISKASVIHGKMTGAQKKKVTRLEDELESRPGVKNKYALARHIALKKKSGGY